MRVSGLVQTRVFQEDDYFFGYDFRYLNFESIQIYKCWYDLKWILNNRRSIMTNEITLVTPDNPDFATLASFPNLHKHGFVRGVSELDQWYLLVNESWKSAGLPMNETVRDYLVAMLNRFIGRTQLFEQLSAFGYFEHLFNLQRLDPSLVQDVADMSLQYVAYFPEQSNHRHQPRSIEHSSQIGVELYNQLAREATGKDDWYSLAYRAMAVSFGQAVIVLRSVCPRFMHKRQIYRASLDEAVEILTDQAATQIVKTTDQMGQMFIETEGVSSKTRQ